MFLRNRLKQKIPPQRELTEPCRHPQMVEVPSATASGKAGKRGAPASQSPGIHWPLEYGVLTCQRSYSEALE